MEMLKLDLLASLPAYTPAVEERFLRALGQLVDARPTAVHPSDRAKLLSWLIEGLSKSGWSKAGTSSERLLGWRERCTTLSFPISLAGADRRPSAPLRLSEQVALKAVEAIKGLGRNPLGSEVLATPSVRLSTSSHALRPALRPSN